MREQAKISGVTAHATPQSFVEAVQLTEPQCTGLSDGKDFNRLHSVVVHSHGAYNRGQYKFSHIRIKYLENSVAYFGHSRSLGIPSSLLFYFLTYVKAGRYNRNTVVPCVEVAQLTDCTTHTGLSDGSTLNTTSTQEHTNR